MAQEPWQTLSKAAQSITEILYWIKQLRAAARFGVTPNPDHLWEIGSEIYQIQLYLDCLFRVLEDGVCRPPTATTKYLAEQLAKPMETVQVAADAFAGISPGVSEIESFQAQHAEALQAVRARLDQLVIVGPHATGEPVEPKQEGQPLIKKRDVVSLLCEKLNTSRSTAGTRVNRAIKKGTLVAAEPGLYAEDSVNAFVAAEKPVRKRESKDTDYL